MEVAIYRGRGAGFVLVHPSIRPPRVAEAQHGPLRYMDTVKVDGNIPADAWGAFADQIETRAFATVDEAEGLRLLQARCVKREPFSSSHA